MNEDFFSFCSMKTTLHRKVGTCKGDYNINCYKTKCLKEESDLKPKPNLKLALNMKSCSQCKFTKCTTTSEHLNSSTLSSKMKWPWNHFHVLTIQWMSSVLLGNHLMLNHWQWIYVMPGAFFLILMKKSLKHSSS